MKLPTFYLNYFPEILITIFTYFIAVLNEYQILLFLISLFTFFLFLSFVTACSKNEENSNSKCDFHGGGGEACPCLIFFLIAFLIFYLITLLFKKLGKKGRIIFFHIFSGFISVVALDIVFTKYEEKNDFDYIMIAFYIVYLCFLIITPIVIQIINVNNMKHLNVNDKIINDSNVNNSSFIEKKDNQNDNKDLNINSGNNKN